MDDTIVPIGDPETVATEHGLKDMEHRQPHRHTPRQAEDPSVSCPPEHPFALH